MRVFIALVILVAVFFVCLLFGLWWIVSRWLKQRRKRQLAMLDAYSRRLRAVVDGLLARANEVDQDQLYFVQADGAESSRRLGKVCSDLVVLADSLTLIDEQLKSNDVRNCRDSLLKCCRIASYAARELDAVQTAVISSGR